MIQRNELISTRTFVNHRVTNEVRLSSNLNSNALCFRMVSYQYGVIMSIKENQRYSIILNRWIKYIDPYRILKLPFLISFATMNVNKIHEKFPNSLKKRESPTNLMKFSQVGQIVCYVYLSTKDGDELCSSKDKWCHSLLRSIRHRTTPVIKTSGPTPFP